MRIVWPILLTLFALLPLAACTAVSAPPNPPAPLPTLLPTADGVITNTLTLSDTHNISQTIPANTPTPILPTRTPAPTATPVTPALALSRPLAGESLPTGQPFTASGTRTAEADWRLELALFALDGRLLTAVPLPITETGTANWQAELPLPSAVTGQAVMQLNLFNQAGNLLVQESRTVTLLPNPDDRRVLWLQQPLAGDTAVPGYYIYFDGQSQLPAENLIRLALLDENCQTVQREDSFRVSGSGYWQGFLPVPDNASAGPACIRVAFGSPQSNDRRETLLPITLLAPNDPQANQIRVLGALPSDGQLRSGETRPLFGLAYNAPNELLYLSLALPDGTVLLAEAVEVNAYGYWETTLRVPVGVTGQARLLLYTATAVQTIAEQAFILRILPD